MSKCSWVDFWSSRDEKPPQSVVNWTFVTGYVNLMMENPSDNAAHVTRLPRRITQAASADMHKKRCFVTKRVMVGEKIRGTK